MQAFRKTIQSTANRYDLWKKGDRIIIGVSGGPDSIALLHFFLSLREKYNLTLFVAHINYHLRDKESDLDQKYVEEMCEKHDVPCFVLHSHDSKKDENTLRDIRFSFLQKLLKKHACNSIALAHHQDDQGETLFLRLLRGSGLHGMQGMRPKNSPFIRPFLFTSQKEIYVYLRENNLSFRTDTSNNNIRYTRNYVRHEIIPRIKENIQPNISTVLSQTATRFAEDESCLQEILKKRFSYKKTTTKVQFSLRHWQKLPISLQRRALLLSIKELYRNPPQETISFGLIEEIRNTLSRDKSKKQKIALPPLILERSNDTVTLFYSKKSY